MRKVLPPTLLAVVLMAGWVALGGADNATPSPEPMKITAAITCGAVDGERAYAVSTAGTLLAVDLKERRSRDLGTPGGKLLPYLDVADGKACVAEPGRVHVVNLADGKPVRSVEVKAQVVGLGFLDGDRILVHEGTSVTVLDAAGKATQIDLATSPTREKSRGVAVAFHRLGKMLYTGTSLDGNLHVVDLEAGKVVDTIATKEWRIGGVRATADSVCVLGHRLGYGVWTNSVVRIDLKTKKATPMDLPGQWMISESVLREGPDGALLITGPSGVWVYNTAGKLVPTRDVKEDVRDRGVFLGTWNGQAVLAEGETIRFTKLPQVAARAN